MLSKYAGIASVETMTASSKISVDISQCEREPIHTPGTIQPHGCLIVTNSQLVITHISQNARSWFPSAGASLIGFHISTLFEVKDTSWFDSLSDDLKTHQSCRSVLRPKHKNQLMLCSAHHHLGRHIFEFEYFDSSSIDAYLSSGIPLLAEFQKKLALLGTIGAVLDYTVQTLRQVIGFDRVLAYRFDPDWHGVVISEANTPGIPSFLGLHFPASDIPAQARRLYEVNPIRVIGDRFHVPVPIIPFAGPDSEEPVDLTHAHLRSVSSIHLEYLGNLGVTASASLSLSVNGKLWGLIACHHQTARHLSPITRDSALLMTQAVSLRLQSVLLTERSSEALKSRTRVAEIASRCSTYPTITQGLVASETLLRDWIPAEGLAVTDKGVCFTSGETPGPEVIQKIVNWLQTNHPLEIFKTTSLAGHIPQAEAWRSVVAGLLSIPIRGQVGNYLLLFRPEVLQTTSWAGNPSKSVIIVGETPHLSPRRSFAVWSQITHLHSLPWSDDDVDECQYLNSLLHQILQSRIEALLSQTEAVKGRHRSSLNLITRSVSDFDRLARRINLESEKLLEFVDSTLPVEGSTALKDIVLQTRELSFIFSDIKESIGALSFENEMIFLPIGEIIDLSWQQVLQRMPQKKDHLSLSIIPIITPIETKSADDSVCALLPSAATVCLRELMLGIGEILREVENTIYLEYKFPEASDISTWGLGGLFGPDSQHHRQDYLICLVRGPAGVGLQKVPDNLQESLDSGMGPSILDGRLGFRLTRVGSIIEALGGVLRPVFSESQSTSLLVLLPLAEGGGHSDVTSAGSHALDSAN
jgi:chemotaxis family two-component system sensor kinase Cph1